MANSKKRISELPALNVASLDTTFVLGISGSTTYKISINQLTSSLDTTFATDLVTATLSGSLDGKLTTSSFNSYTASISTASLVTSISNLNTTTSSLNISVNALNTATSSYETKGRSIVSGSSQLTSSFDTRYAISASFVSSSNLSSIRTITSASYAALTPVSGTLYIIIG